MPTTIRPIADNPIFILGPHKSGTSLLRSLFDGHPDLFVIPTECHFFWHAKVWIEYPYRKSKPPLKTGVELRKSFIEWIDQSNRCEDRYGDCHTKGQWDIEQLKDALLTNRGDDESLRQEIDHFVNSMWYALKNGNCCAQSKAIRFVEKSVENAELAPIIKKMYPDAHFIHIVRNPYSNFVSFRKYKSQNKKYPFIIPLLKSIYLSYYHLYRNRDVLDNYHIVSYEQLVQRPQKTLKNICSQCGVSYDDCLLEPTLLGKRWDGNSMYDDKFKDISTNSLSRWKSEIYDFEIYAINKALGYILDGFGYERLSKKRLNIWPIKHEPVNTYIKNRYFMKYSKNIF